MELAVGSVNNNGTAGGCALVNAKPGDTEDTEQGALADGLTGNHLVFHLDATEWGFGKQTMVIVFARIDLPILQGRFPGAAFWARRSWAKFVRILHGENNSPDANLQLLAQVNSLKITFDGIGASIMITDDDLTRWTAKARMQVPADGSTWDRPAKKIAK